MPVPRFIMPETKNRSSASDHPYHPPSPDNALPRQRRLPTPPAGGGRTPHGLSGAEGNPAAAPSPGTTHAAPACCHRSPPRNRNSGNPSDRHGPPPAPNALPRQRRLFNDLRRRRSHSAWPDRRSGNSDQCRPPSCAAHPRPPQPCGARQPDIFHRRRQPLIRPSRSCSGPSTASPAARGAC